MADVFSTAKRSWVMSRIRGSGTGIERGMDAILRELGASYEYQPSMFGNPDFAVSRRIAVFCDGDFWHGYGYWRKKRPADRFWREKIEGNMRRDRRVSARLRREGWSVLRFWGHDISRKPDKCAARIRRKIREVSRRPTMRGAAPAPRGSRTRSASRRRAGSRSARGSRR